MRPSNESNVQLLQFTWDKISKLFQPKICKFNFLKKNELKFLDKSNLFRSSIIPTLP